MYDVSVITSCWPVLNKLKSVTLFVHVIVLLLKFIFEEPVIYDFSLINKLFSRLQYFGISVITSDESIKQLYSDIELICDL